MPRGGDSDLLRYKASRKPRGGIRNYFPSRTGIPASYVPRNDPRVTVFDATQIAFEGNSEIRYMGHHQVSAQTDSRYLAP